MKAAEGEEMPAGTNGVVVERELYGNKLPWQIFSDGDNPWETKRINADQFVATIYCLTRLKKLSKEMTCRGSGGGTWDGDTGFHKIFCYDAAGQKRAIGSKKYFTFRVKDFALVAAGGDLGHWTMWEYSLALNKMSQKDGEYVTCKIKKNTAKELKMAPKAAAAAPDHYGQRQPSISSTGDH